jgi:phospholipid/cholesterol/gamma-HCH transport system substrate-binding protein
MDTQANYTLVGAFVILITAAIVFAVIWLSSGLSAVQYKNYLTYSQESVSGLSVDAPVEYNGVNVGSVKEISIDQVNPHLVKVLMRIDVKTPITNGTSAMLTSRGLTGVAFIALKDTGKDLRPLTVLPGQDYPIIPTTPSIFVRLDTALTSLTKNFQKFTQSMRSLLDAENLHSFKQILANLNQVTRALSNNTQQLNSIMLNTVHASKQLTPLLENSSDAMKTLKMQTLPETYQVLSNLNDLSRNLKEVSEELKENPTILVRGRAQLPLGPGERQ